MTYDNTLLGRCLVAYEEALNTVSVNSSRRRAGLAAVLEHLAAEIIVMHQRNQGRLSAHDAAMMLREQAGWDEDPVTPPPPRRHHDH